jgi:hypothetical protein
MQTSASKTSPVRSWLSTNNASSFLSPRILPQEAIALLAEPIVASDRHTHEHAFLGL